MEYALVPDSVAGCFHGFCTTIAPEYHAGRLPSPEFVARLVFPFSSDSVQSISSTVNTGQEG